MGREFLLEVNFVGCLALERVVRSMLVVPIENRNTFLSELVQAHRNDRQAPNQFLDRTIQSFDHSNAAMLANRTKTGFNHFPFAQTLVTRTPELHSPVTDQMPGFRIGTPNRPAKKRSKLNRSRLFFEHGKSDYLA